MDLVSLVGFIAFCTGTFTMIPQLIVVYRHRAARDLSLGMIGLGMVAQLSWGSYGYLIGDTFLVWSALVAGIIQLTLIGLYMKFGGVKA